MPAYLNEGIQNFCGEINEAACYALCLLSVADEYNRKHQPSRDFDVLGTLSEACSGTGADCVIYYNRKDLNDNNNFFVQHPDRLLKMATGKTWMVTKEENIAYVKSKTVEEYLINYYERKTTGKTIGHFDRDEFHPWKDSLTVRYGAKKSIRVCRVLYG